MRVQERKSSVSSYLKSGAGRFYALRALARNEDSLMKKTDAGRSTLNEPAWPVRHAILLKNCRIA